MVSGGTVVTWVRVTAGSLVVMVETTGGNVSVSVTVTTSGRGTTIHLAGQTAAPMPGSDEPENDLSQMSCREQTATILSRIDRLLGESKATKADLVRAWVFVHSPEDVDDANQKIKGNFVGIGIRFQILRDTLMVVATIPGGPSEKLGLLPGDKIVRIGTENVAGIGLKNSQSWMKIRWQ